MSNYVVKNCPAVYRNGNAPLVCCDKSYRCDLVEDCLIKTVINMLRTEKGIHVHNKKVLAKFDIEEVG